MFGLECSVMQDFVGAWVRLQSVKSELSSVLNGTRVAPKGNIQFTECKLMISYICTEKFDT